MSSSLASSLASLAPKDRQAVLASLTEAQAEELLWDWRFWARPNQIAPDGDWQTWLALAGRGFGKTEAGAQWVRERVSNGARSIALLAETQKDLEEVMVARLLAIHPPKEAPTVRYKPVRLIWPNGAVALGYNGTEPDQLRGPEFDTCWCFVAGTLVETSVGQVPIERLSIGDLVVTREGLKPVEAISCRPAHVGQVLFENGSSLVGTADHPVYTTNGWTRLDSLAPWSRICVSNAWSGAASGGTVTGLTTSAPLSRAGDAGARPCIGRSTEQSTAASLTDAMCITSTGTLQTTTQRTLRRFLARITSSTTPTTLKRQDAWRAKLNAVAHWFANALIAVSPLRESGWPHWSFAGHADQGALNLVVSRRDNALSAEPNSQVEMATFVRSGASTFRPLGERDVFCLKVAGQPEYFANGILVHNCDELAKYRYAREIWDMLQFTMRSGTDPRVFVTTTPRPIPVIREILADAATVVTRGSTFDNAENLPAQFLARLKERYAGTRLGRQELEAEILDDVPGALWTRAMIDDARKVREAPPLARVVIGVDPSGTGGSADGGDSIGIVAAGKGYDGRGYILGDWTCKLSPAGWGRRSVEAYAHFKADRIAAEKNYGGAMVESVIRTANPNVAVKLVNATRGKVVRAEPIAALYEQGRVSHVGEGLEPLEDEMVSMTGDGFLGEGSPNRVDAAVWALTELMLDDETYDPDMWASLLS